MLLIAAKDLRRLLIEAKREGFINGVNIARSIDVTHLLFVNDIFLFAEAIKGN